MDNEDTEDTAAEQQPQGDESVEDFKDQVEGDPSTAKEPDDGEGYGRLRGG